MITGLSALILLGGYGVASMVLAAGVARSSARLVLSAILFALALYAGNALPVRPMGLSFDPERIAMPDPKYFLRITMKVFDSRDAGRGGE